VKLDVYLNFRGTCEEAFRFYEQELGGTVTFVQRHAEQPNPGIPPDWREKVLHAQMQLCGVNVMGADIPNAEPMRSAYISLTVDSPAEADRLYDRLSDGGEIFMKMESTFFANRFAMLRDRFGISWMLLQGVTESQRPQEVSG
jgi:PhnB protein